MCCKKRNPDGWSRPGIKVTDNACAYIGYLLLRACVL
nr:MAG TPA: hypothetical protein [Caudoviricetes sp.]